jgi:FixJ family two-component response regulator
MKQTLQTQCVRRVFHSQTANQIRLQCRAEAASGAMPLWKIQMSDLQEIVAVIDDDPEMRSMMWRLAAYGYRAETYDSAETFLTCASTCNAICLLVDIQLGDISGVELAHQLAADRLKFQIVFMSGLVDRMIEREAVAVGGIACLRKPVAEKMLIDAIKKAVGAN